MEPTEPRSNAIGPSLDHNTLDSLQFNEEVQHFMTVLPENANSFTALLELPASQAGVLLHHSPESNDNAAPNPTVTGNGHHTPYHFNAGANLTFPTNIAMIERAARFSVLAGDHYNHRNNNNNNNNIDNSNNYSPETRGSVPSNSRGNLWKAKNELAESDSNDNPNSSQHLDIDSQNQRLAKRKEREKAKEATKKSKSGAICSSEEAEKLPYVHVRARRGQATDSHSLAERARREKINARMKLLQELVPGCNKISGTTLVLDEIINHVQLLQRQVEVLSMRLAAVNPRIEFNLDSILAAESGALMDSKFPSMVVPVMWPDVQVNGNRQQYEQYQPAVWGSEEESHNFVPPEN